MIGGSEPVRIIVTGGRFFGPRERVWQALDLLHQRRGIAALAHGATPTRDGADWHADAWAKAHIGGAWRFPVMPEVDGPWPGAGFARNARMLRDFRMGKPIHGVVAFPGGNGTQHMAVIAERAGIPVWRPYGAEMHRAPPRNEKPPAQNAEGFRGG